MTVLINIVDLDAADQYARQRVMCAGYTTVGLVSVLLNPGLVDHDQARLKAYQEELETRRRNSEVLAANGINKGGKCEVCGMKGTCSLCGFTSI